MGTTFAQSLYVKRARSAERPRHLFSLASPGRLPHPLQTIGGRISKWPTGSNCRPGSSPSKRGSQSAQVPGTAMSQRRPLRLVSMRFKTGPGRIYGSNSSYALRLALSWMSRSPWSSPGQRHSDRWRRTNSPAPMTSAVPNIVQKSGRSPNTTAPKTMAKQSRIGQGRQFRGGRDREGPDQQVLSHAEEDAG